METVNCRVQIKTSHRISIPYFNYAKLREQENAFFRSEDNFIK